ncbi:MAG: hypothetical protein AB1324_08305 [Candidatus Micrarchaeota archaeon]
MEKKIVKWSAVVSFLCASLVLAGILTYVLMPFVLSFLLGTSDDPCAAPAYDTSSNTANVQGAMANLCNTAKSFIGITVMVLIIIASPVIFVANCISSMDVYGKAERPSPEKIKWLAAVWLLPGLGNTIYYLLVKRKEA